jgi:ATP-binding protein involved in chromosome partitioning
MADLTTILDQIVDPLSGKGLLTSGRVSGPRIKAGVATIICDVTGLTAADRQRLEAEIRVALLALPEIDEVRVAQTSARPERRIIAVGSGKGGVGKSTVAANLAIALARAGHKIGLVDADIYGPSQVRLFGAEGLKPTAEGKRLSPVVTRYGVPLLSMAMLVAEGQAIAWRGPMAGNALAQMLEADWANVDVLIVDLPPGTGDVQLSMLQKHKPAGAVIVSTPQDLALIDATRAIDLFNQAGVPIIGLIENMAGYCCPHCGKLSDPFGQGGAEAAATRLDLPFLGRIPLALAIREASDRGEPPAAEVGEEFAGVAIAVSGWLSG